jgi:hypothetical protein
MGVDGVGGWWQWIRKPCIVLMKIRLRRSQGHIEFNFSMEKQMHRRSFINRLMAWGLMGLAAVLLSACSVFSNTVYHSFMFILSADNQDAEVIDYRYGEGGMIRHADPEEVKKGIAFCCQSFSGSMLKGDFLYMKWRNIPTGKIYEDTVDLKSRLPRNIEDHTIYPMIYGSQLYVYLISPDKVRRSPTDPEIGPRMYRLSGNRIVQIYPDQPKK